MLEEAARTVRARVEPSLVDCGLVWDHVAILTVLAGAPAGHLAQSALRERTGIDRTSLSSLLAELCDDFYVARERDLLDQRQRIVELTPHGRAAAEDARRRIAAAEREALRPLTAREQERLHQLLGRLLPPQRHQLADLLW